MRIMIATGIYPPEIGGPAFYAKNLAEALRAQGQMVDIATFGPLKSLPSGVRHVALFLKILPMVRRADVVLALDTFSAALPAYCAARLFGKKMVVRTGGDFVWEQYVERTGDLLPLPDFYAKHKPFTAKERMYVSFTKFLTKHVFVVFSSEFQKTIWRTAYEIEDQCTSVVTNAITERMSPLPSAKKNFLFYGRDLKLRNKKKLLEAFQKAKKQVPDIVLETGQIPQAELIEKIRSGYCVIMPSISDVTPNYILDALRCGKPFILTRYSEYATRYEDFGLMIDPLDVDDMAQKIVQMCDDATYTMYVNKIRETPLTRTYTDLARDYIALFTTAI